MSERDIFLALLDLPDPAARAAYLDEVCGGDLGRRARVKALLRSHDMAGGFLDKPAFELVAACQLQPDEDPSSHERHDPLGTQDAGPTAVEDRPALDFLQPSTRPGSLGRVAHYEVEGVLGRGG